MKVEKILNSLLTDSYFPHKFCDFLGEEPTCRLCNEVVGENHLLYTCKALVKEGEEIGLKDDDIPILINSKLEKVLKFIKHIY